MKARKLPLHYWPTTVVFVDDSRALVDALELEFSFHRLPTRGFYHPQQALQYFREDPSALDRLAASIHFTDTSGADHQDQIIHFDIQEVFRAIYDPKRFAIPSVMVVDYGMPGMSGMELCQALNTLPTKKLMLTGEATDDVGVRAFNERIIDRFLSKGHASMSEELLQNVDELLLAYFLDQTPAFAKRLYQDPLCLLGQAEYVDFAHKIFADHQIAEYYVLEKSGSLLMLTAQGEPFWLLVRDGATLNAPLMGSIDASAFTSSPLPGLPRYHYTLIQNTDFGLLQRDRILSLNDYLAPH